MTQLIYVSPAYERIWGRSAEALYRDATTYLERRCREVIG